MILPVQDLLISSLDLQQEAGPISSVNCSSVPQRLASKHPRRSLEETLILPSILLRTTAEYLDHKRVAVRSSVNYKDTIMKMSLLFQPAVHKEGYQLPTNLPLCHKILLSLLLVLLDFSGQ